MDVLSDAIAAMRSGRPYSALTEATGPWTRHFPDFAGARLHVVLSGAITVVLPGREPVVLGPGEAVVLPGGAAHDLADAGVPTRLLCGAFQLEQARVHPLLAELPELLVQAADPVRQAALHGVVSVLGAELAQVRPGRDAVLPALLEVLLVYLLRAWLEEHGADRDWGGALRDPVVGAALRAIHQDPAAPWTVETLGARAGLSRAAFARRFSQLVGQPPLGYLTWWRLTTAAHLLRTTDATLATIARRCGYGTQFALANAFKREYGMSAGRYRQLRRTDHEHIGEWERPG
ncbi:AraC family transcriptional regulator [Crossiella sp. SN42]|uniref:AraC family transcriptional regulator n=1 Tax=Crossiella sp. SN42 TaxID=2944808 RepID=UPI00207CC559|nr:AraC family transcriptional regulator [Crossiella sp. SN42]MCO1580752.1 AraC family transcriptional regulator [Crossiella sp. SN42]